MTNSYMMCELSWNSDKRYLQFRQYPLHLIPIKIIESALYALILHFDVIYFQNDKNPFYFLALLIFGLGFVSYMSYLIKEHYVRLVHGHVLYEGVLKKYMVNIILSWSTFGSLLYLLMATDWNYIYHFLFVLSIILAAFFQYFLKARKIREVMHLN